MSLLEAYNYLDRYGGIAFLDECYAAEHLLSIEEALHDLIVICKNNGGGLILYYTMEHIPILKVLT